MEACVVICRTQKPAERKGKVLFIDAVNEVARERAQSFLKPEHQERIVEAYQSVRRRARLRHGRDDRGDPRQGRQPVDPALCPADRQRRPSDEATRTSTTAWAAFDASGREFWQQMDALVDMLDGAVAEEASDA